MMEAANLAGKAINISKTTAAHAWSYAITSNYSVPHVHAVWLTLPRIFEMHATASPEMVTDPRGMKHPSSNYDTFDGYLGIVHRKTADVI